MEAIIKSPLISDEVVLWPREQKPVATEKGTAAAPADSANTDVSETQVEAADANLNRPFTANEAPAAEAVHRETEFQLELNETRLRQLEEEASKTGYEQGFTKGEAEAKAKYSGALLLLEEALESVKELELQVIRRTEGIIGAIVFEAVSKIIGARLCTEEGRKQVISQVIQAVNLSNLVKIKVSPQDLASLKNDLDAEIANLPWEADSSIELGGCIVELTEGSIDARVETQFRMFAQSIKEAAGHVE